MVKYSGALVLTLLAFSATAARHEDLPINSGSELRDWCRRESEATLIGRGIAPSNWTASYWDQENVLMVKGAWRVNGSDVIVECRVGRGAEARYATMSIREP
jgi:hypothetical protein